VATALSSGQGVLALSTRRVRAKAVSALRIATAVQNAGAHSDVPASFGAQRE